MNADAGHFAPSKSFSARMRRECWQATLAEAGIRPPRVLVGDWTNRSGYLHGEKLAANADVTAVFAANDQMGLGIMRAMHEVARDIPGEVSVVGFDDMEDSDAFWPPLTTIHQEFDEVGRHCVATLLREIRHDTTDGARMHTVPTRLVVRQSAGPPRRNH